VEQNKKGFGWLNTDERGGYLTKISDWKSKKYEYVIYITIYKIYVFHNISLELVYIQ